MREISQEPLWARPASARALPGYKDPLLKAPRSQRAFLPCTARSHLLPSSSLRFQSSALASRGNPLAASAGGQATHRLLPRRPPIPTPYGPRIPTLVLIQGPLTALDLALHSSLSLTQANPLPRPRSWGPQVSLGRQPRYQQPPTSQISIRSSNLSQAVTDLNSLVASAYGRNSLPFLSPLQLSDRGTLRERKSLAPLGTVTKCTRLARAWPSLLFSQALLLFPVAPGSACRL